MSDPNPPMNRSLLHDRLVERGGDVTHRDGWEWMDSYSGRDHQRDSETDAVHQEHQAAREAVALFDRSGEIRYSIEGEDALTALQFLCAENVDVAPGRTFQAHMYNDLGRLEARLRLLRRGDNAFWLLFEGRPEPKGLEAIIQGVGGWQLDLRSLSQSHGVLSVVGPVARKLLRRMSRDDLGPEAFGPSMVRDIHLGEVPVTAVRSEVLGEVAFELHVREEDLLNVYEAHLIAGEDLGLRDAGLRSYEIMRVEKGSFAWGTELTSQRSAKEIGALGQIAWKKQDFLGREALSLQRDEPVEFQLFQGTIDDVAATDEFGTVLLWEGRELGWITSATYSPSLGKGVLLGFIHRLAREDELVVDVGGAQRRIRLCEAPAYDPSGERLLA